jgi:hypothetical protein
MPMLIIAQVTGHPLFEDWLYQADLLYVAEQPAMIYIRPAYVLMPPGKREDVLRNVRNIRSWLFKHLQVELLAKEGCGHLTIDWSHIYLFGASFGAVPLWGLFCKFGAPGSRPQDFRIRAVILRYGVSKEYRRDFGEFMGTPIDPVRAMDISDRTITALQSSPWTIPRTSETPPRYMFAVVIAMSKRLNELWKGNFPYDDIQQSKVCPDPRARILFIHGDADKHVSHQESIAMAEMLRSKWPDLDVQVDIVSGEAHAWDYTEAARYIDFLEGC